MNPQLVKKLSRLLGSKRCSTRETDRNIYSCDMWAKGQIWKLQGDPHRFLPDMVLWPETPQEVQKIIEVCAEYDSPVIPFGGGSGKCGGAVAVKGGVILDGKRMNKIISIDPVACTVTTECGVLGEILEQTLNASGFTLGHFPTNMSRSTIGGWLATRSAGQYATRYGKIEDMVLDAAFVDGRGHLWKSTQQRSSGPGIQLLPLILGSEGIFGVFTQVTLRIHPLAPHRAFRAIEVPSVPLGLEVLRLLAQNTFKPLMLELYDPLDTYLNGLIARHETNPKHSLPPGLSSLIKRLGKGLQTRVRAPQEKLQQTIQSYLLAYPVWTNRLVRLSSESCILIVGFEGGEDEVEEAIQNAIKTAESNDGHDLGSEPVLNFHEKRNQAAFKQPFVYKMGGCIDVLEVAVNYHNAHQVYEQMMSTLSEFSVVMANFGHANLNGCSINFSFALREKDPRKLEERYNRIWRSAMNVLSETGGVLSHHEGIGVAKRDWIRSEIGAGVDVIRAVKRVLDPSDIMNPSTLIP